MAFNLGNVTGSINRAFSSVSTVSNQVSGITNQVNSAVASVQRISSIAGSIDNISQRGASIVNDALGSVTGAFGSAGSIVQGINNVFGGSGTANIANTIGNITGSAEELSSLVAQPIRVIERSSAEIFNAQGGRFDTLRQDVQELSQISEFGDFLNLSLPLSSSSSTPSSPVSNSGQFSNSNRIPNPLREHNSHNYIVTLGILSAAEYNNPLTYRGGTTGSAGGFEYYIAKSAGGNYEKRWQVEDELNNGSEHAEYFIEDLEMDAVIAPNRNTNVSLGTTVSFNITEPYSMGNFIEAIIGAAQAAGFSNYLDAPFCLKFDFVGWDEYGVQNQRYIGAPMFVPIKITKVDFNVSGSGSYYEVKAVPMSEAGLSDEINQIKTDINATGTTVAQVLENAERSVTQSINERIATLEESGALAPYDRFVIAFPKNRDDILNYINENQVVPDALQTTAEEEIASQRGLPGSTSGELYAYDGQVQDENLIPASRIYEQIKSFVETESNLNEIGKSVVIEDTSDGGDQSQAPQGSTYDEVGMVPDPAAAAARPGENAREHQFSQGQTITSIIETILLRSQYGRERATEESTNGIRRWFRIDTNVFYEPNPSAERQMGRPPKVYVYSVIPYEVDEAVVNAPNERPQNTEQLIASAAKEYNYIYTGKNEDVLNFDISFNNAFTSVAFANFGMNTGSDASGLDNRAHAGPDDGLRGTQPRPDSDLQEGNEATGGLSEATHTSVTSIATRNKDIAGQVAEMYHDRIVNMPLDMVTAEIEIMGDPFFIPQEMGNYVAPSAGRPGVSQEGTMSYQRAQVFIVVNFMTPFDYQIKGATMEMPKRVPQFSGLFTVWAVTNMFSGGKFTQRLKLFRRRGQDDEPTTGNSFLIRENSDVALNRQASATAAALGATGNAPNVGYGVGQIDPMLAAAAAQASATNLTSAASTPIGYGIGQVDPALARAASQVSQGLSGAVQTATGAIEQATSSLSNIGYGVGQIDPGLARAAQSVQGITQSLSPAISEIQNVPAQLQGQLAGVTDQFRSVQGNLQGAVGQISGVASQAQSFAAQAQGQLSGAASQLQSQASGALDAVNRITGRFA